MAIKNIIFIATNTLGNRSAEATHNVEMAVQLNKINPVWFIGGIRHGQSIPDQLRLISNLTIIKCKRKSNKVAHFEYEFKVISTILKALKTHEHPIVYVRYRITGLFLFYFLIKQNIPFIVEYNDKTSTQLKYFAKMAKTWSRWGSFIRSNSLTLWFIETYESWVCKHAFLVRVVTPQLGDYIKMLTNNNSNVCVIPNATNIQRFYPQNKHAARIKLGLPLDKTICIHIGSLTPWDGIQDMIHALPYLQNVLFIVVGNKNQFYEVLNTLIKEKKVQDQVIFTGGKPQEIVQEYVAAADICLLLKAAMDYGLSPIKYYEYMACGRPILTINDSLINNVINDKCGDVINTPIKINEIVKKIRNMENMDLDILGKNARIAAEKKYTWEHRSNQLISCISKSSTHLK